MAAASNCCRHVPGKLMFVNYLHTRAPARSFAGVFPDAWSGRAWRAGRAVTGWNLTVLLGCWVYFGNLGRPGRRGNTCMTPAGS
eukprot:365210-Chlamydomonas_euryale.AAC.5